MVLYFLTRGKVHKRPVCLRPSYGMTSPIYCHKARESEIFRKCICLFSEMTTKQSWNNTVNSKTITESQEMRLGFYVCTEQPFLHLNSNISSVMSP